MEFDPFLSLNELGRQLQAATLTPRDVAGFCLRRIEALDAAGAGVKSVIEVNPDALQIADQLGKQTGRGPLHGLPVLIKDNIDTADAMQTTAGSLALLDTRPRRNAHLVRLLREAGAVILGKTNLSEWANIRSPRSTSGWSARGGLTRNPHVLDHNPSGSSSGSAAAVAAGLVPAAIGTETNGSIISPASACGIVGLKPTLGLVSRSGVIPITRWQDTAGPMTRTVMDAALVLNAIAGVDSEDQSTTAPGHPVSDYTAGLSVTALRGARLGVVRSLAGDHPQVQAQFEASLQRLREAGAEIIDEVTLPQADEIGRMSMLAMLTELRGDLNACLAARGGEVDSLAEVIAFNQAHADREMPHFGQEFFEQAEEFGSQAEALASGAEARQTARRLAGPEGIDAAMQKHRLDALICPTNDPIHKTDLEHGDARVRCACTPAAVAGYPHLTVPMGFVGALPIGLSFFGAAWSEARLLALGHAFETIQPARKAPRFLASA